MSSSSLSLSLVKRVFLSLVALRRWFDPPWSIGIALPSRCALRRAKFVAAEPRLSTQSLTPSTGNANSASRFTPCEQCRRTFYLYSYWLCISRRAIGCCE